MDSRAWELRPIRVPISATLQLGNLGQGSFSAILFFSSVKGVVIPLHKFIVMIKQDNVYNTAVQDKNIIEEKIY